jgi:hypothetical protein
LELAKIRNSFTSFRLEEQLEEMVSEHVGSYIEYGRGFLTGAVYISRGYNQSQIRAGKEMTWKYLHGVCLLSGMS